MSRVFFITHPDVAIDPSVPVPDLPLNERGRSRMSAMTACPWARGVHRILASSERKARDAAHMTQEDVAKAMGTSQEAIARLESGKSQPSTRTLQRFARATGMRLRISFEPENQRRSA